ncbi:MAG: YqgE/AlgH family protein [Gemmobacter sp.]|nr:YqgE/AlgH family protein [Gemmobacter sp.]
MKNSDESKDLSGKFLIAMPAMADPRFERSVVFLCSHSSEGTMGIIINKMMPDLGFATLLDQLEIARGPSVRDVGVHFGGPVEHGRGFVLHSDDFIDPNGTMVIPGGFAMTATQGILKALAQGSGPNQALLALGYAGWGPGQLDAEIMRNDWLTCDASDKIVFARDNGGKWAAALRVLGVDPITLSAAAGRA